MGSDKLELSRIVGAVSRQAGAVVGTSVANTKKITSLGAKGVSTVKDLVTRPARRSAQATGEKIRPTSKASALKSRGKRTISGAKAEAAETVAKVKANAQVKKKSYDETIAKLETEAKEKSKAYTKQITKIRAESSEAITSAKAEVAEMVAKIKANAEETIAKLKSDAQTKEKSYNETIAKLETEAKEKSKAYAEQIAKIRVESNGAIAKAKAEATEKYAMSQLPSNASAVRTKTEAVLSNHGQEKDAVVPVENVNVGIEKRAAPSLIAEAEAPNHPNVMLDEAHAATFPNAAERIIFTRALSDIVSQDAGVRADAAKVIASIRHELSVKALVARMAREPSPRVRQECIKALTTLNMKEAMPAVRHALTDQAASVRLAAVWGLYRLNGTESGPALAHMISDEDEEVRRRAAICIGWLGQEELAAELLPLLADSSVSVRRAAIEAMGYLRSRRVVSALIKCLNDPEKSIRKAIIDTLKTITGKKMSGPFTTNEKSLPHLIARWQEWWKGELLG